MRGVLLSMCGTRENEERRKAVSAIRAIGTSWARLRFCPGVFVPALSTRRSRDPLQQLAFEIFTSSPCFCFKVRLGIPPLYPVVKMPVNHQTLISLLHR
jgi:hypothetical protein